MNLLVMMIRQRYFLLVMRICASPGPGVEGGRKGKEADEDVLRDVNTHWPETFS